MKILIVDDHAMARDALGDWLRSRGLMEIYRADSVEASRTLIQQEFFDVAIIDIKIPLEIGGILDPSHPSTHGLSLGEWLRSQQSLCSIVFISAHPDLGLKVQHVIEQMGNHRTAYLIKAKTDGNILLNVINQISQGAVYIDPEVAYTHYPSSARTFLEKIPPDERDWVVMAYERLDQLKPYQMRVLKLAVQGYKQREVATRLNVTENMVERSLAEVYSIVFPQKRSFARPLMTLNLALLLKALCDESNST